jgi:hypothetical protein
VLIYGVYRFPAPGRGEGQFRENVMGWIEQQATEAWAPEEEGIRARAAVDFLTVCIKPVPVPSHLEAQPRPQWTQTGQPSPSTTAGQSSGQGSGHGRIHGRYAGGPPTPSNEEVPHKRKKTERQVEKSREEGI